MIWFDKSNPFPVLLYFISVTTLGALFNNPYHTAVTLTASIVMFVMIRGKSFFVIFLLTFIVNPIVSKKGSTPLLFIGDSPITLEAVVYGLNSAALITAVMFLFYTFTRLLDSEKLLYLLSPFSASAALTVSAVLRFAPLYIRQARQISAQQRALGAEGGKSIPEKLRYGAGVFSALSTWALENGITAADSMACRGYGTGKRSFFSFFGFRRGDLVFLICELLLAAAAAVPAAFAQCAFEYYPKIVIPRIGAAYAFSAVAYTVLVFLPVIFEITDRIKWKYLQSKI